MKILVTLLMILGLSSFAHAEEVCGTVKSFSAVDPSKQYVFRVEFTDGIKISNVLLRFGQEALVSSSLVGNAKLCFYLDDENRYRFSSVSK